MAIPNNLEELQIRCDALRGVLYAECGFELEQIAALENAALLQFAQEAAFDKLNKTKPIGDSTGPLLPRMIALS